MFNSERIRAKKIVFYIVPAATCAALSESGLFRIIGFAGFSAAYFMCQLHSADALASLARSPYSLPRNCPESDFQGILGFAGSAECLAYFIVNFHRHPIGERSSLRVNLFRRHNLTKMSLTQDFLDFMDLQARSAGLLLDDIHTAIRHVFSVNCHLPLPNFPYGHPPTAISHLFYYYLAALMRSYVDTYRHQGLRRKTGVYSS
jgi:hypothetical protein